MKTLWTDLIKSFLFLISNSNIYIFSGTNLSVKSMLNIFCPIKLNSLLLIFPINIGLLLPKSKSYIL